MVARIETLLVVLHKYFSKSPKCHLKLQKLAELLESKGRKFLLEAMKVLVVFTQSPNVYVCDFTRALSLCISNVNDLYCTNNAFISDAFSCFKKICDLLHESICLRWHPNVNDYIEHLVF
jgi:hypothetical protein